jgi:hypothetical protein
MNAGLRRWHPRFSGSRRNAWVALTAPVVVLVTAAVVMSDDSVDCTDFRAGRTTWSEAVRSDDDSARHGFADGLVKCQALQGASRAEVFRLLGPPTEMGRRPEEWVYALGDERSLIQMDSGYLSIKFDTHDSVRTVEVT